MVSNVVFAANGVLVVCAIGVFVHLYLGRQERKERERRNESAKS
jgi:hypothetical protein